MFQEPKPFISYKHLEAKSPEELEQLMLLLSVKSNGQVIFTPPSFSNSKWHTWYMHDFSTEITALARLNLGNK